MVNYTLIDDYSNGNMSLTEILAYPTTGDPYFYVLIVLGINFIIASVLYFSEVQRKGTGNLLSSVAVSCFVGIVLTFSGSLVGLFTLDKVILMFVIQIIPIAIWWFGQR